MEPLDPSKVRRPSKSFGWVDHRIVKSGYLERLGPGDAAVYLLLCVVADRHGISFYRPETLGRLLKRPAASISAALSSLSSHELIALSDRYVQVRDLDDVCRAPVRAPVSPGPNTAAPGLAPEPPAEPAADVLARLPGPVREAYLSRARQRLAKFLGARAPTATVLAATAAALWREETAS